MRKAPLSGTKTDLRTKHPKKIILVAAFFAIWFAVFWQAIHVYGPGTALGSYSSDEAIPILMSNDDRPITLFNSYYYGAGRWGGWPFLFAQVARRTTGYRWSDQRLFVAQTAWVFIGALVIAGLCSNEPFAPALIYLLTICLHRGVSMRVFSLSQVYAWQITALLLAWYGLRHFLEDWHALTKKQVIARRTIWGAAFLWFSFLSIWSSSASIPLLLFLVAVEAARAHWRIARQRRRQLRWPTFIALALVVLASSFEFLMRVNYHRHNLKHYHFEYRWRVAVDRGYLMQNLRVQIDNLLKYPRWRTYYLLALVLVVALFCFLIYLSWRNGTQARRKLRQAISDDILVLIVASFGIAFINFVIIILVDHVRINLYDNRFMTLTYLFGSISGLLSVFLVFRWVLQRWTPIWPYTAQTGFAAAVVLGLVVQFPPRTRREHYDRVKEISFTLERKAPRAPLMGSYWDTYIFVAQQSENGMIPVPLEGQDLRTPWTPAALQTASLAVLEYGHGNFPVPELLSQRGVAFKLVDQKWYENGEYAFALYMNDKK